MSDREKEAENPGDPERPVTPPVSPIPAVPPVSAPKGCICVNSNPLGAEIQLDGVDLQKKTPTVLTDIEPGNHTVVVTLEGISATSKKVQVTAGSTTAVCLTLLTGKNKRDVETIVGWTFLLILVLGAIAIVNRLGYFGTSDNLMKIIIYCACAGGLGALTFNFYGFTYHLGKGDFDLDYFWWYIGRPFIGIVYGIMILFLVAGGLMTLGAGETPLADTLFTLRTVMFYIALAFLAGYAEEPVSLQIVALAEALFKKPSEKTEDPQGTAKKD
jgi:hypothetical protein